MCECESTFTMWYKNGCCVTGSSAETGNTTKSWNCAMCVRVRLVSPFFTTMKMNNNVQQEIPSLSHVYTLFEHKGTHRTNVLIKLSVFASICFVSARCAVYVLIYLHIHWMLSMKRTTQHFYALSLAIRL